MIRWLFETLIGWPWCWHKWAILQKVSLYEANKPGVGEIPVGGRYVLQCTRCGDLKRREFR